MNNLIERIALYADIDTRRALGIYGRVVIPPLDFQAKNVWRYWPAQKKAIFFCADPRDYEFEVHNGLVFQYGHWFYEEGSCVRSVWKTRRGKYTSRRTEPRVFDISFSFAEKPQFMVE